MTKRVSFPSAALALLLIPIVAEAWTRPRRFARGWPRLQLSGYKLYAGPGMGSTACRRRSRFADRRSLEERPFQATAMGQVSGALDARSIHPS
jgi:hypothetical protein